MQHDVLMPDGRPARVLGTTPQGVWVQTSFGREIVPASVLRPLEPDLAPAS